MRDDSKPMIFHHSKPFKQLDEEDFVYTVRAELKVPGPVWIRKTRTGVKKFDAKVESAERLDSLEDLEDYLDGSGFEDLEEWKDKVRSKQAVNLYIHRVVKV